MTEERLNSEGPDYFVALYERFKKLTPGQKAELRRVEAPDDLALVPAFYVLFPGQRPMVQHRYIAFLLPWCSHKTGAKNLGTQLAEAHVAEARVIQTVRSKTPLDMVQLRRLAMQLSPDVDWASFGRMLMSWDDKPWPKRKLVEDFFLTQFNSVKGAKK